MKTSTSSPAPHAGQLVARVLKARKISKAFLSRLLGVRPSVIIGYTESASMRVGTLWQLSLTLRHNFFADIAAQLPPDFATEAPRDNAAAKRIAELQKEIEKLKMEIAVWEKVGGRGLVLANYRP